MDEASGALGFACFHPLPGEIQTVARAETYALMTLVLHLDSSAIATFITDNGRVWKLYHKGGEGANMCANRDMYEVVFNDIEVKHLNVTVNGCHNIQIMSRELVVTAESANIQRILKFHTGAKQSSLK